MTESKNPGTAKRARADDDGARGASERASERLHQIALRRHLGGQSLSPPPNWPVSRRPLPASALGHHLKNGRSARENQSTRFLWTRGDKLLQFRQPRQPREAKRNDGEACSIPFHSLLALSSRYPLTSPRHPTALPRILFLFHGKKVKAEQFPHQKEKRRSSPVFKKNKKWPRKAGERHLRRQRQLLLLLPRCPLASPPSSPPTRRRQRSTSPPTPQEEGAGVLRLLLPGRRRRRRRRKPPLLLLESPLSPPSPPPPPPRRRPRPRRLPPFLLRQRRRQRQKEEQPQSFPRWTLPRPCGAAAAEASRARRR